MELLCVLVGTCVRMNETQFLSTLCGIHHVTKHHLVLHWRCDGGSDMVEMATRAMRASGLCLAVQLWIYLGILATAT